MTDQPARAGATAYADAQDLLTLEEAAQRLRVSVRTAGRLCQAGAPSLRVFTTWRMSGAFVDAALAAMACGPVDLVEFAQQWGRAA